MSLFDYGSLCYHLRTARTINRRGEYWQKHGRGVRAWTRAAMAYWRPAKGNHAQYLKCDNTGPTDKNTRLFWVTRARELRAWANWRRIP